jgi:ElaA protein
MIQSLKLQSRVSALPCLGAKHTTQLGLQQGNVNSLTMSYRWRASHFSELTPHDVYDLMQLRAAVFVLEHECLCQDIDNQDYHAYHLLGTQDGMVLACARLFAPGQRCDEASIDRIATARACRRAGVGKLLMQEAIKATHRLWGPVSLRIATPTYLQGFFESFGFECMEGLSAAHTLHAKPSFAGIERSSYLTHRRRLEIPDLIGVFDNRAITGKLA